VLKPSIYFASFGKIGDYRPITAPEQLKNDDNLWHRWLMIRGTICCPEQKLLQ